MGFRTSVAAAAVLLGSAVAPVAASARIESDGVGMAKVEVLTSTSAPVTEGVPTWIALNWTNDDAEAGEFEVTASGPEGVIVEYPSNTHPFSSLWADNRLSPTELDYTALKITAPDGSDSPIPLRVRLSYVSQGRPVASTFAVQVPVEKPDDGSSDDSSDGSSDDSADDSADDLAGDGAGDSGTDDGGTTDDDGTTSTTEAEDWAPGELLTVADAGWSATATPATGAWEVGTPEPSSWLTYDLQAGSSPSGSPGLYTGLAAGGGPGANDVDGGRAAVLSRPVRISSAAEEVSLAFDYYFTYLSNSTSADYFRVSIVGDNGTETLLEERGRSRHHALEWRSVEFDLDDHAGQEIQLLIEVADDGAGSLIEAGIDGLVLRTDRSAAASEPAQDEGLRSPQGSASSS